MTITEFLQTHVPFLSGITEEQARVLAGDIEQRTFGKDKTILFRGTTVDGLYVIAQGKVTVWVKPPKGKTSIQVAELGPGETFGETSIMENSTAGATIKASEDGTLILVIPQDDFRQTLADHPDFDARLRATIDDRKKKTADRVSGPGPGPGPGSGPAAISAAALVAAVA